ncbi:neuropeptide CCHamide-1 receptor-like [Ischnura elegans]|uniref:neuropeptide CCHamide-1 receptor-like n=1 Tax=Ischnura elegans TaxID=197161 RepID=UPI001ED896D3|nr:neuropeptide CCHamide-1 receptor-like [Ischnura elegans]
MEDGEVTVLDQNGDLDGNLTIHSNFSTNNTDTSHDYVPYSLRPETYIVPIVFAIIFMVGVLGNGTLVLIFLRNRNMRNAPSMYVFSLALGDLLVIITCVPFTSTVYTVDSWPYGVAICKMSEFAKDVSIGVSVFTLTALSANRFFGIVDPMRTQRGSKNVTRFTVAAAALVWVLAILCAIPAALASHIRTFTISEHKEFHVCFPFWDMQIFNFSYPQVIVLAKFFVYYLGPLTIIAFFYILMACHLMNSIHNIPGERCVVRGIHQQQRQKKARKKVSRMLLAFVLIFAICFLPQHIFMLWFYYYPLSQKHYNAFWHSFRIIGFCLGFINSCINPIALYFISGVYRKQFHQYLFCWLSRSGGRRRRHCRRALGKRQFNMTRERTTIRSLWDSSHSLAHFNSTLKRVDECTLTTLTNGAGAPQIQPTAQQAAN